jgi:phosphatidylethanolamine-binding protein (PEBP) family uncharacterized protein
MLGSVALVLTLAWAGCGSGGSSATSASTPTASTPTTTSTPTSSTATTKPPSTTTKTSTPPSPPAPVVNAKAKAKQAKFGAITLTSAAFAPGGPINARYTCDGAGVSPPLQWRGVPNGTAELVLLVLDLSGEAKGGVQWAVAGIPPSVDHISAGSVPAGAVVGANSLGKNGWGGVCAAKGVTQHVLFLLYALRKSLNFSPGFNALAARGALKSERLASGLTAATYDRA